MNSRGFPMTDLKTILPACVLAFVALAAAGCGSDGGDSDPGSMTELPGDLPGGDGEVTTVQPGTVRFVHISDTHVHGGPDAPYAGKLEQAVTLLNGVDFAADFVVVTGDLIDFLPEEYMDTNLPGTLHVALETLEGLQWPFYAINGNHEYYRDDYLNLTTDKAAREDFLADMLGGGDMDYWFDQEGIRFILMNSMAGDQWDKSAGLVGSFTPDQLTWLRDQLVTGMPTLLFFHHPPVNTAPTDGQDSLCEVMKDHPGTVRAVFAGHLHGFWNGDFCGVKYRLVGNTDPDQAFYYLVEYDGATDTLTVINEADLPSGTLPEFECAPDQGTVADPASAVGTIQVVHAGSMVSNLPSLEGFQGDKLDDFPPVIQFESWNAGTGSWLVNLTLGISQGGFIAYTEGIPCEAMVMELDGVCLTSNAVSFELDAAPILEAALGIPVNPDWVLRATVENLWFEARVEEVGGVPVFKEGLLHLAASATRTIEDLKFIMADEYCAGKLAGCVPGDEGMPTCPAEVTSGFYDQVPESCDMTLGGLSMRFILLFAASYPLDNINLQGELWSTPVAVSDTPAPGFADTLLFSNCTL